MLELKKLKNTTNTFFDLRNYTMTKEELLQKFEKVSKELEIIGESEDEDFLYLYFANGNTISIRKPRSQLKVEIILMNGKFPPRIYRQVWHPKQTKCLAVAQRAQKGLCLCGPAGIGKTFACIWHIVQKTIYHNVNAPLYIALQEITPEDVKTYKNYDCYLLDDVNANLATWKFDFIRSVIYHAYNNAKKLYITSNLEKKELMHVLAEEPIISRVFELCEIHEVIDKDLRQK